MMAMVVSRVRVINGTAGGAVQPAKLILQNVHFSTEMIAQMNHFYRMVHRYHALQVPTALLSTLNLNAILKREFADATRISARSYPVVTRVIVERVILVTATRAEI